MFDADPNQSQRFAGRREAYKCIGLYHVIHCHTLCKYCVQRQGRSWGNGRTECDTAEVLIMSLNVPLHPNELFASVHICAQLEPVHRVLAVLTNNDFPEKTIIVQVKSQSDVAIQDGRDAQTERVIGVQHCKQHAVRIIL